MKLKSANLVTFDIGSSKMAALAANINKQGVAEVTSQIIRSSDGFCAGKITDLKAAEESFISCIYDIENDIDRSINQINLALSGIGTKSFFVNHTIKLGSNPVNKNDLKKLIQKAISDFRIENMDIIHYFPIEYVLDDDNIVENPIGLYGSSLSCQLHIIAANSTLMLNLSKCLARCQVEIKQVVSSVYAAGIATLTEDEKKLGSIIIDLGSHTTSFAVFYEGKCFYVGSVPLGSYHITSDIARVFSIGISAAEKIKILHGTADYDVLRKNETIRLEDYEDSSNYETDTSVSTKQLTDVINSRLNSIFSQIKEQYDNLHMDDMIARRMVITGGGANLHGLVKFLGSKFNKQVRVGRPFNIDKFLENNNSTIFSSVIGLIRIETDKIIKRGNTIIDDNSGWMKKTFAWIRENI